MSARHGGAARSSRRATWLALLGVTLSSVALGGCPEEESDGSGGAGGGSSEPAWQVVFDGGTLDRALLSVWGSSSKDVWAVGGPLGNAGFEALVLRFDGSRWRSPSVGGADSYWWVHGSSASDVWLVGEKGRITHYDGTRFEEHTSGTSATLWGAIAFAPDDVWAVGGMPGGPSTGPDDVVLHYDGAAWGTVELPGEPLGRALFKVWGTSSDELFVVGEYGTIWQKTGDTWTLASDPPVATGNLTTVAGCSGSDVWAVGQRDVLHYDGVVWTKEARPTPNDVNGVACREGAVSLVGGGGLKQRRTTDGSWFDDFFDDPHGDLHGTWIDETGAIWAVGGDFISSKAPDKPRNGIVTRYAAGRIAATISP